MTVHLKGDGMGYKVPCGGHHRFGQHWRPPSLQWRHNERDGVPNHQPHDCLLNRLFRRRSKKTSKLRITGLCEGNSTVTGDFPTQRASNAENVSIWRRHHDGFRFGWSNIWYCANIGLSGRQHIPILFWGVANLHDCPIFGQGYAWIILPQLKLSPFFCLRPLLLTWFNFNPTMDK